MTVAQRPLLPARCLHANGNFQMMSTTKGGCQTQGCENPASTKAQTAYDDGPRCFNVDFVVCADCAEKIRLRTWPGRIEFPDLAAANVKVVGPWIDNSIGVSPERSWGGTP